LELTLKQAKDIIEKALETQKEKGFKPMAVVVLGAGGTIKASESQDGTSGLRPKIAHGKAFGAYSMGIGSRALFERAKVEPFFIQAMNSLCDGETTTKFAALLVLSLLGLLQIPVVNGQP